MLKSYLILRKWSLIIFKNIDFGYIIFTDILIIFIYRYIWYSRISIYRKKYCSFSNFFGLIKWLSFLLCFFKFMKFFCYKCQLIFIFVYFHFGYKMEYNIFFISKIFQSNLFILRFIKNSSINSIFNFDFLFYVNHILLVSN